MRDPCRYLVANAAAGMGLVRACVQHGIGRFVLSSTANIYGAARGGLIGEDTVAEPSSPYGDSKWMIERTLAWAAMAHGLHSVSLRYFNAAGADPDGVLGEDHDPETHLIPLAIDAALGRREALVVFGSDHATADGTCVRDYVHVTDLARAHLDAMDADTQGAKVYNVGNAAGHSVLDVIRAVHRVSGRPIDVRRGGRRAGDPPALVADNSRIMREIGWRPRLAQLDHAVDTALSWRLAHPLGYADRALVSA